MLRTPTVTQMERDTIIMVNRRYFPSRGTAREVGGMISASSRKNTVRDTRMLLQRDTWGEEAGSIQFNSI